MVKKSILSVFLLISMLLFSSLVIASDVVLTGTSVVSPFNVTNASNGPTGGVPVLALKVWDTSSSTLDSVVVSVGNLTETFSGDGDLATLATGASSGLQLYKDSNSNGIYDSGTDARVTYDISDWSSNTNNMQNVTFSGISGFTLPSTVPSTSNLFVVIKMIASPSDGAQFNVSVLKGAVKSSGNATGTTNSTDVSSGRIYIDTTNPTIAAAAVNAQVNDTDRDGYVDQARIVFNEAVNDSIISITGISIGNLSNFTVGTSSGGYLLAGLTLWTGGTVNDNELYVNFTEQTAIRFTNQSTMTFNYSTNGTVKDIAGNSLQAITNRNLGDGAAPILWNITTNDSDPRDGRVGALTFTFSEPINDTSFNLSADLSATMFVVNNGSSTDTAANDNIFSVMLNQANSTKDGNLTGTFSCTYGLVTDISALNDGRADELDNKIFNITTQTIYDRVVPMIERFEILDTDNNGWLDAIRINFSEPINDSTINASVTNNFAILGAFNRTGNDQNMTGFVNFTPTYMNLDVANNNYILLNFSEAFAQFNTSGAFKIIYTANGNGLCDFSTTGVNCVATNSTNDSTSDKAPPVIMGGLTYNLTSNDSTIDYINLTLSELITTGLSGSSASTAYSISVNTVNGSGAGNVLTLGNNNVTISGVGANVTLGLNGLIVGTGNITLNYTPPTAVMGSPLNDSAGNTMIAKKGIQISDGLRPVLYNANYLDNDTNGWTDAVQLNFTEPIMDSTANSAINTVVPISSNFSISGITKGLSGNLNFTNDINSTANPLIGNGINDNIIYLYWAGNNRTYQTNGTITLNISGTGAGFGGNPLTDTNGNGIDNISNFNVNDKAAPAIYSVFSYDTDYDGNVNYINLTISEAIVGSGSTSTFSAVVTDGTITGKNVLTISSVAYSAEGNITVTFSDTVPGTGNITFNYTRPAVAMGKIQDAGSNVMDTKFSFAVIDNVTPKLTGRFTVDNDSNGWVEMVALNFSEEINDSSVAQQMDQLLAGFAGKNINFSVESISKDGSPALNWTTGATANDAIIYLNWSTINSTLNNTYNTSATPIVNYTKGIVSDTSGNLLETNASTASTTKAIDSATPIIMDRFTVDLDGNGFIDAVGINFSENMNDLSLNKSDGIIANASRFNISLISGNGVTVEFTTNYNGDSLNNNLIYLNWSTINNVHKTNATPTINYTSGNLSDLANNLLATSNSGVGAKDRVAPRIMNVTTIDSNANGWLDAVKIYLSEPINDNTFLGLDFNVSGIGFTDTGGVANSHALNFTANYNSDTANDDIIYLNWSTANTVHNTGATPYVNMTGNLSDLVNNVASNNVSDPGITSLVKVVPILMNDFTVDNNTNGYLDAIGYNFSENLNDQSIAAANATNFNITNIAGTIATHFTTNYHGDSLNNNLIYINWSYSSTTYNTSFDAVGLVNVNYTAGNLSDLANNLVVSAQTIPTDKASPAILSFIASDNLVGVDGKDSDDKMTISFSESIQVPPTIGNGTNGEGIEGYFPINGTKRWNNISTAAWSNNDQTLTITLHASNFTNISTGDVITPNSTLGDSGSNKMGIATSTLTGTFDDSTIPKITYIETLDNDSNGKVDQIKITFDESVVNMSYSPNNATTFTTGFSVGYDAGNTFTIAAAQNDSATVIVLNLTEKSAYNTSILPWVYYNPSLGNITDLAAARNRLPTFNITANDSAAPVPIYVYTFDNDSDGFVDRLNITFSEEVNDSSINISSMSVNYTNGTSIPIITMFTGTGNSNTTGGNDSYIELVIKNISGTGDVPQLLSNGTGSLAYINYVIEDMHRNFSRVNNSGNYLKTISASTVTESDKAIPVIVSMRTVDQNSNGYLDAVKLYWSENINDQSITSTNSSAFSISGITGVTTVHFTTNYNSDLLNDNIIYLNWSNSLTTYNTSSISTPHINYTAGNLSDLVNNLAASNTSDANATDAVGPVIISFVASDGTNGINGPDSDDTVTIKFSEIISGLIASATQGRIVNGSTIDPSPPEQGTSGIDAILSINGSKKWNNVSTVVWSNSYQTLTITMQELNYTNMTPGDVITPTSYFNDSVNAMTTTATLTGTFDDTASPYPTSIVTFDNNSNGKIDQIKITFNENVINMTYSTNNATTFTTGFSVGYDVGNTFTIAAAQNDSGSVIVLNLTEKSGYNTSMLPWVYYTSSQGNITDLAPNRNRLASFNITANDTAPPVPVTVYTYDNDSDGFIDMLNVTFSEQINDSSLNLSSINITDIGATLAGLNVIGFNTGTGFNDSYLEFTFTDNRNNTGHLPQFLVNSSGSNYLLQDMVTTNGGNMLRTVSASTVTETDGAKPVFMPLNLTTGNFSNLSKMASNNMTSLWFNVSEPITALSVVVGNVTANLQVNTSNINYTYNFTTLTSQNTEGTKTITISALDAAGLNTTNTTQSLGIDFTKPAQVTGVATYDRSNDDGKHVKVVWTANSAGDFNRYNVYIMTVNTTDVSGMTPINTSITTAATTRTLIATINSSNLTDGTTYYVAVTAKDDIGNENTTVVTASAIPYDNSQITPTANEWNLVSTTQTLANTTKSAVFNSSYTLWWYNDSASAWASPSTLDQYKGYWLYDNNVGAVINLSFKNNAGPSPTLGYQNLTPGWNLIGSSREADLPINTTLNSIDSKYSVVYEYTVGTGWRTYTAGATTTNSATEFLNMTAGRGYWIFMTTSGSYSGGDL